VSELTVFDLLFETRPDGSITPRVWIQILGTKFGPGASFGPDYKPGGYSLEVWRGKPIGGHHEGNVLVIDAVPKPDSP
jgi:hypothetical protein